MKMHWKHLVAVLAEALMMGISLSAQVSTGTILGVVKDDSGASLPGATVTATEVNTGFKRSTTTGQDGSYNLPLLPTGSYSIRATADNFQVEVRTGVTLEVAAQVVVGFSLKVGAMTQTVTVSEEVPLVNTTSSSIGNEVGEQKITSLPLNGRNYADLTLLQPGVTESQLVPEGTLGPVGTGGLMFSSGGSTLWSNMYMIDGANTLNYTGLNNSSIIGTTLGLDGIKEYRVITGLPSAQYGMVTGSTIVIASKGGTNAWHGNLFEYLRNNSLDARNYFDVLDTLDANGCSTDKSFAYPCKRLPPFHRNNFGAALGGPIKKDKAFFWATYEGVRQAQGQSVATETIPKACFVNQGGTLESHVPAEIDNNPATNPYSTVSGGVATACLPSSAGSVVTVNPLTLGLADLFPQPNVTSYPTFNYTFRSIDPGSENYGQARVDYTISTKQSAFVRYTQDDSDLTTNKVAAGQPSSSAVAAYPTILDALHSGYQLVTADDTYVLSSKLVNDARFSFSRTANLSLPYTSPSLINSPVSLVAGMEFGSITPDGAAVTPFATGSKAIFYQNIYQGSDDILWTKGKHDLKFGALIQYYNPMNEQLFLTAWGSASFLNLTNFFVNANYSSISVEEGSQARNTTEKTVGFYVQDDYRATSRLTLNLGLRYEFYTVPKMPASESYELRDPLTDTTGTPGPLWLNPSLRDFSPRLGFAWDVFGNGKTSLRGGWGILYDIASFGSPLVELAEGTPPINATDQIMNTTQPCTGTNTNPCFSLPLPIGNAVVSPKAVNYHLQQPRLMEYTLTVEQQLPWHTGLSVGYVGSRGYNLETLTEGNPTKAVGNEPNGLPYYCTPVSGSGLPSASNPCSSTAGFPAKTNPAFGEIYYVNDDDSSWYNSLQIGVNKQISQGLQFQTSYTWQKMLDNGTTQLSLIDNVNVQSLNPSYDVGPSAWDAASNARINIIYHAPVVGRDNWITNGFVNGWWFSSILSAQSGFPVTPILGEDRALQENDNTVDYPNLDPTFKAKSAVTGKPNGWFNVSMFDLPPAGTLGNESRGMLRGPGLLNLDFSTNKDFAVKRLGEGDTLDFRVDIFNILNHANFETPQATIWTTSASTISGDPGGGQLVPAGTSSSLAASPTAGAITGTVASSRQMQMSLTLNF